MNNLTTQKPAGSRYSTMSMVQVAIFGAIICIMAFTPFLGYIPLGITRATIIHIPVIIASLLMGPKKGGVLGFVFGLTSFITNTVNPTATSFVFTPFYSVGEISGGIWSVIICFVPRILVGIVPYFVYKLALRFVSEDTRKKGVSNVGLILAGVTGALVNTLLVMNLIFIFYGDAYIEASGKAAALGYTFIVSVIGINGVPEAIIAGILTLCIGKVLLKKNVRERLGF
ncbi:MAG TPA: ECF transporter S component [Candidatus Mediterraneibacter ornithocaccae]|uniref:ECF transporter S component n=1 Tax=Mediterraneibacter glycyrrhizinilyticus TaxID=342942 RepID=UPI001F929540|nr:ECF transporter S component [Mediterraneibacter glycyrrhizinilyticus]MDN0044163.1 ECF transporter S component [Mediterraneibacter glycyrrhizinilyticus]HJA20224.1 ECF transporter S component [Candidatus Mediterraneibacter ornithocaccae]